MVSAPPPEAVRREATATAGRRPACCRQKGDRMPCESLTLPGTHTLKKYGMTFRCDVKTVPER